MSISKINANQTVSFQGKIKSTKNPSTNNKKETVKKIAIAALGITAATLGTIALIKRIKAGKTEPVFVPGSWQPKTNPGQELETFNTSVKHALNTIRTADLNDEIARVERNVANHDLKQLELDSVFNSSDFVNNVVTKRADLDIQKAQAEAAEIMKDLVEKAGK
ncbi:MAG: hypothetical protein E7Z88_03850 [Cyanobacteria bacterium SIG27]|nr:hypothetical protein [Cyanobacteria bacterium SIG27]